MFFKRPILYWTPYNVSKLITSNLWVLSKEAVMKTNIAIWLEGLLEEAGYGLVRESRVVLKEADVPDWVLYMCIVMYIT